MPDHMDAIQDLVLQQQNDALERLTRQRERQVGLPECERCTEEISPLRQSIGARLCLDCQRESEAHAGPRRVCL